jgi:hypothetical protein
MKIQNTSAGSSMGQSFSPHALASLLLFAVFSNPPNADPHPNDKEHDVFFDSQLQKEKEKENEKEGENEIKLLEMRRGLRCSICGVNISNPLYEAA